MLEGIVSRGIHLTIAVLVVCVLGVIAVLRIPVQMIPDLEVRTVTVRTSWPGATPQDVEKEILVEQEEYLRNVPGLQRMISTADTGSARIELEFPFGIDINETLIRVNNALSQVPSYPVTVDEPRIYASSFSSNSFMYFRVAPLAGSMRSVDMDMIRDFVEDNVRPRMERVPGVSEVRVYGGAERHWSTRRASPSGGSRSATCATPCARATATSLAATSRAASGATCCARSGGFARSRISRRSWSRAAATRSRASATSPRCASITSRSAPSPTSTGAPC